MTVAQAIIGLVLVQRLAELWLARRNADRLLDEGAIEHGAGHYPLFVVLHAAWLTALVLSVPREAEISVPWLAVFIALQAARVWVIASLGRFWTTRILTLPGASLVRRGPYRWLRHPNYVVVAIEIVALPLVFGEWALAAIFGAANLALLRVRIRIEDSELAPRRDQP